MGSHRNIPNLNACLNVPAHAAAPPPLNQTAHKQDNWKPSPTPYPSDRPVPLYARAAFKPEPPPAKPRIPTGSMEPRFKPPFPTDKPLKPVLRDVGSHGRGIQKPNLNLPNSKPGGTVSALRKGLEKGGQEESKGASLPSVASPKPFGLKSPPVGSQAQKGGSGSFGVKPPPPWKKPELPKQNTEQETEDNPINSTSTSYSKPTPPWKKPELPKQNTEQETEDNPINSTRTSYSKPTPPWKKPELPKQDTEQETEDNPINSTRTSYSKPTPPWKKPEFPKQFTGQEKEDNQINSTSTTFPKPPPPWKKPELPTQDLIEQETESSPEEEPSNAQPKKKPLPRVISTRPPKPRRPPRVDLKKFSSEDMNDGPLQPAAPAPETLPPPLPPDPSRSIGVPPPPANFNFPPPPPPSDFSLPPPPPPVETEGESYDDVGLMNNADSQPDQSSAQQEEDFEELYEDIEERWLGADQEKASETKATEKPKKGKENKEQKKKSEKEEKKEAEREKKEKKEQEKREQEARKKFKLKGPIEVLHEAKATKKCKGGKTELPLEEGETVEIIRTTGNPEGRWLARNSRGFYGYVKTNMLETDATSQQEEEDTQDFYDDVAVTTPSKIFTGSGGEGGDIYDDVEESGTDLGLPPPPPPPDFIAPDDDDDDTYDDYDDVESPAFPAPPAVPSLLAQSKTEQMDPKKKKKFEKEEKEFRKKFKYDQEIQVLYEVTILSTLACKKFGSKDLVVKPGEVISVIVKPNDGKLIGRNSEGKFGYVSVSNIQQDSDIYDDIGEDCIYDND